LSSNTYNNTYASMSAKLKTLVHSKGVAKGTQILMCLGFTQQPASVAEVRTTALSAGLRTARKWNISAILGGLKGRAVRTPQGWELTEEGANEFARLTGGAPAAAAAHSLRTALTKLSNGDVQAFVAEAISCVEGKQFRAAVVLSWVGALALLYDHVVSHALAAFNAEALRRDAKWKAAKTTDDLSRMKEHDFLQVLEAISVIGKNVKTELEAALKLRNACGHPNSLKIAEHRVASHIETLSLNVFATFS
jgi:hypothetical protein